MSEFEQQLDAPTNEEINDAQPRRRGRPRKSEEEKAATALAARKAREEKSLKLKLEKQAAREQAKAEEKREKDRARAEKKQKSQQAKQAAKIQQKFNKLGDVDLPAYHEVIKKAQELISRAENFSIDSEVTIEFTPELESLLTKLDQPRRGRPSKDMMDLRDGLNNLKRLAEEQVTYRAEKLREEEEQERKAAEKAAKAEKEKALKAKKSAKNIEEDLDLDETNFDDDEDFFDDNKDLFDDVDDVDLDDVDLGDDDDDVDDDDDDNDDDDDFKDVRPKSKDKSKNMDELYDDDDLDSFDEDLDLLDSPNQKKILSTPVDVPNIQRDKKILPLYNANFRKPPMRQEPVDIPPVEDITRSTLANYGLEPYMPQPGEEYMSPAQIDHIREILERQRVNLVKQLEDTKEMLREDNDNFADDLDKASQESEFAFSIRNRDRERRLIEKIDNTITRIKTDPDFGYCEDCGEEIGLRRMEARPTATLCINCKEKAEHRERQQKG